MWAVRHSESKTQIPTATPGTETSSLLPSILAHERMEGVASPAHLSWWDGQMQEFCPLVPNLGVYIPTQEELRLQRIR